MAMKNFLIVYLYFLINEDIFNRIGSSMKKFDYCDFFFSVSPHFIYI